MAEDTPFYVDPTSGKGYGTTANDYQYYQNHEIVNPNIDWSSTSPGAPGLINAASTAKTGEDNLQKIIADTKTTSSVNDTQTKKEEIAGAERSKTAGGESKNIFDTISESFSKSMQKNGGDIFANALSGTAQGVLAYLIQRRKERADLDLENRRNQNRVNETNASVARASAMPRVGSVIRAPQTGLINARSA